MDLYYIIGSPPCRAVLMVVKALGIEINLKETNTREGAQMKPEFLKMNPQHTVPTLNDNGFYLYESRAIMVYLVEKYGKDSTLYPTDPQRQAIVNQRLYFDMGTLNHRFGDYFYPQFFRKFPADPEKFKKLEEAFEFLNTFLQGHKYVAGDDLTLADYSLVATVSMVELLKEFEMKKYPNVTRWLQAMKNAPGYSVNQEGIDQFKQILKAKMNK